MRASKNNHLHENMKDYIRIARPDHWIKHVFILPGIIFAFLLTEANTNFVPSLIMGLISACLLASANYVINEWCDAEFDKFHPIKKNRPAPSGRLAKKNVIIEYVILSVLGLWLAKLVNSPFFITGIVFLGVGLIYNIKPLRLKDRVVLDVLTEALNNPLRLLFGWCIVSSSTIPPMSLTIFYWYGGAFLMAAKRLAEVRHITKENKMHDLKSYRKSFHHYTENSLLITSFLYGLLASFLISAFLLKYRNEYLFVFPVFATLFTYYLALSLREAPIAQTPEKLHKDKGLVAIIFVLVLLLIIFTVIDIPLAQKLIGSGKGINYNPWK